MLQRWQMLQFQFTMFSIKMIQCYFLFVFTALAMAQKPTESLMDTPAVLDSRSCEDLDKFENTTLMEAKTFVKNIDECTNFKGNKTHVSSVLVDLVSELKDYRDELFNLTSYPDIMNETVKCARDITGFKFTESEARKRFGLPNTVTFKFEMHECKNALKMMECVEDVYSRHLNATTKKHKNAYIRLFEGIQQLCELAWIEDKDRSSGHYRLPSLTLILGSVLMILKSVLVL